MEIGYAYFSDNHNVLKEFARQLGVKHAVTNTSAGSRGCSAYVHPWDYMPLLRKKKEFEAYGIDFSVYEGVNFIDSAKLGLPDKDEAIAKFCTLLENMNKLKIPTLCFNWMPIWEWFRTRDSVILEGGAVSTGFDIKDIEDCPVTDFGRLKADALWTNLEYFLKKVVPVAEKFGIQLAIHPDDPPVSSIGGIDRILTSSDAMYQATRLVDSEINGITLCQGTFAVMGEDIPAAIRRFGKEKKLFFVHFRDVVGDKNQFYEAFHHAGKTDMYEAMKCYYEVGFKGVARPDHVPTMADDSVEIPGYGINGNLLATGYMLGLMEAAKKEIGKAM